MAFTAEIDSCRHHLPPEHSACPHCGRPTCYQNVDDKADDKDRAALEDRHLPARAEPQTHESAVASPGFEVVPSSQTVRGSTDAVHSKATFAREHHASGETDPENSLLVALSEGDQSAFWPLWEMHSSRLYGICLREMNRNREEAEEALAQSMMKALNSLPVLAPKIINPKAWLIRLTYNLCKDIYRRRARYQRVAARLEKTAEVRRLLPTYDFTPVAHEEPCPLELERDPNFMIDRLPRRLREVVTLRFIHELSYKEVASRLALTQANVRKRIQQARAILRALRDNDISGNQARYTSFPPRETATDGAETRALAARDDQQEFEIQAHTAFSRTVCVHLPSGVETHFEVFLPSEPSREGQKIKTLRKYVERHARGWKKRLALADLLYQTGEWVEAVDCYRHVLKKQPWLTAVSVRLGEILRLIATEEEAIAVYELALPLARRRASRCHLKGLIACCHHNFPLAVMSFQEATALEPKNAAHWRALAATHQRLNEVCSETPSRTDPPSLVAHNSEISQPQGATRLLEGVLSLSTDCMWNASPIRSAERD